ncbi:MAG TPA: UvrD-helicase domain-containing protein [Verrucomicrobiae bacterium]|jgi:ATP-dependent helicase/nuclease subunit A|nr:UvrD-helicase domain-containing protein [Verrucomicrobiae bacterium]
MSSMTLSQQAALTARGNVLVVAGAGTGKTHTLVERCCSLLLDEGCSLEEILMVTFTDAAAAEMRKRIRARLAEKLSQSTDFRIVQRLEEQIALLDAAYISTLHSFCLRLVREHFHDEQLRLDPEFIVLTEEQAHVLRNNVLDALLEAHYGGASGDARAFRSFLLEQVSGNEVKVRELIWQLHRYSRSLANPQAWFEKQSALFAESEPLQWRRWLLAGFNEWRGYWTGELETLSGTPNVADCLAALKAVKGEPSSEKISEALGKILEALDSDWPRGSAGKVRDRIKEFFSDAAFLQSLLGGAPGEDPLAQDWEWSRGHMQTLLRLAREFGESFDNAKREAGGVDFADLEQFALRLLWDAAAGSPTPLAREWQARFKFVFVDEYQDINEAQDTILRAVSREGGAANRFLVGDVKQSIYRFRLADPGIFQAYKKLWSDDATLGRAIPLSDNFRSREAVLDFANSFFALLMRGEIGGVTYDVDAHLKFGAPDQRADFRRQAGQGPHVEIHIRAKTREDGAVENDNNGAESPAGDLPDLDATEKEARLAALQLKKLRQGKIQIWDDDKKISRAVEWRDMVVLLRSPRNKAEIFAREFNRAGVPLHVKREGFYSATEVSDLLSLLQLLDNPMQDLPLLAVLRSPLVGLSVNELAMIRAAQKDDRFWTAMLRFAATPPKFSGKAGAVAATAQPKLKKFLTSFDSWRRHARQGALSQCMREILDATHYESLILAQERGEERLVNVNRLLRLMRQFDPYQRQGLLRFLRFVEAQRDAESEEEPASPTGADAVRLLSIHQSKGLEFPVVAVGDFGKAFNFADLHADILLDGEFGLCPRIAPPNINGRYPSLPYWLARRRQKRELLGEELRLLYVAMTRARERLLLVGSITPKQFEACWKQGGEINTTTLLHTRSYADWLGMWFAKNCAATAGESNCGETRDCRWVLHDDASLIESASEAEAGKARAIVHLSKIEAERLRKKLETKYPFATATERPAKTSVSALRRRAMDMLEQDESVDFFRPRIRARETETDGIALSSTAKKSGADVGTVHHRFLERVAFDRTGSVKELRAEAERMVSEGVLASEEVQWLNFDSLLEFWRSDFGRKILANAQHVKRELAFTARFSPAELPGESATRGAEEFENEFVVVQGVADLAVILPKEIWLLDFKTDRVAANQLNEKTQIYRPQLDLYARALERIYGRAVTERRLHFLWCGVTVSLASVSKIEPSI